MIMALPVSPGGDRCDLAITCHDSP